MTGRIIRVYSKLLTQHPLSVVAIVLVIVVSCTLLSVLVAKPPDFSDPMQGFIPRHTAIHSSYSAWHNLMENTAIGTESDKPLTTYPTPTPGLYRAAKNTTLAERSDHTVSPLLSRRGDIQQQQSANVSTGTTEEYSSRPDSFFFNRSLSHKEQFFCDDRPRRGYSQLVFALDAPLTALDLSTFAKLCQLQTLTELAQSYQPYCERDCLCRSFSLVNYITYISDKKSCQQITEDDIRTTLDKLFHCQQYYYKLPIDCWFGTGSDANSFTSRRCNVSSLCANETFYELFHYIISKGSGLLTVSFIHLSQGKSSSDFYLDMLNVIQTTTQDSVRLIALDFGLKEHLFEMSLLKDAAWIGLALFFVILIIWIYSGSFFITFMTFSSMLFTIIISFSLYQFTLRIEYFPFLNLLATVVVVGIGADDLFIYWKTWITIKHGRNSRTLEHIVSYTFTHASTAMFVTSASTASAFYASTYTDLVSVRCFCIYAGTCVLVHYLVVVTWLPACVVLYEKYALGSGHTSRSDNKFLKSLACLATYSAKLAKIIQDRQSNISVLSYIWLPLFFAISCGATVALFVWPKISAPSSNMFQMFASDHPFEVFDRDVKNQFEFTSRRDNLPVIFVFGVDRTFNGNYFDVGSSGSLTFLPFSDFTSSDTQLWFSDFCAELRQQSFFDDSLSQPSGCFIEELRFWIRFRPCSRDPVCCERLIFPYNQSVFLHCLQTWSLERRDDERSTADPGVRYINQTPTVAVISFWSNVKFDYNFSAMQNFYLNVDGFLQQRISLYPHTELDADALSLPFFTASGGLLFYDVQSTLLDSLPMSLAVVLVAATAIIFLTTLNVLLTVCALISISCSILTTLGALALMRWELNILESVIVSLAIGLSMDFPLHVAVAYRIASRTQDRRQRITSSLRHVSGSLTAAMATTLVAGLCMLPSQVLAYSKLGTFLALVTVISWLYSTHFMPSLLLHIGPIGSFLQLDLSRCCKAKHRHTPSESLNNPVIDPRWENLTLLSDISEYVAPEESSVSEVTSTPLAEGLLLDFAESGSSSDAVGEGTSLMPSTTCRRLSPIPEFSEDLSDAADSSE